MEVCELHGHLVVDGQEELLSLLQLGLQLFTFRGIQLWGSCWKMVPSNYCVKPNACRFRLQAVHTDKESQVILKAVLQYYKTLLKVVTNLP